MPNPSAEPSVQLDYRSAPRGESNVLSGVVCILVSMLLAVCCPILLIAGGYFIVIGFVNASQIMGSILCIAIGICILAWAIVNVWMTIRVARLGIRKLRG